MKVNLIRKYKWYIVGLIVAWILMAVGLSFCSWDDHSIKSREIKAGTADYDNRADEEYLLVVDNNNNSVADLGDIVTYGKYYQTAAATTKDPIRWIVVHKENNELTLLAESVMAFGSFWNRYYHNGSRWMWEDSSFDQYYQNYMVSTLSMWLNSDYNARHDQGTAFTASASKLGMRGFMNEAFTSDEISHINSRAISDIQGMAQGNFITGVSNYGTKSYKVWVPSWSEIYGTTAAPGGATIDGSPNTQFQYFKNKGVAYSKANPSLVGKTTAFASTPSKSNYTTAADTSNMNNAQNQNAGGAAWWWLRSPYPSDYNSALVVDSGGSGGGANTHLSYGGVRPAIAINI